MRFTFDTDNLVQRAKDVAARATTTTKAFTAAHANKSTAKTVGTILATAAATALALRI